MYKIDSDKKNPKYSNGLKLLGAILLIFYLKRVLPFSRNNNATLKHIYIVDSQSVYGMYLCI